MPMFNAHATPLGLTARRPLVAAMAFLDATFNGDWTNRDLHDWFDRHLVAAGWMQLPIAVHEPGAGSIPLHGAGADAPNPHLSALLVIAREVVVTTLRGLLQNPADDRFLASVIYAGRVRRRRQATGTEWTPNPETSAPLSAVVLSLLAADILAHRAIYEEQLSICELCARVSVEEGGAAHRNRCATHAHPPSGIYITRTRGNDLEEVEEDELFKRE